MHSDKKQFRISAKNLGALALTASCERCIWLKFRMQHRLPFQIFPGIFSSIDAYTKHVIHGWIDANGRLPAWLGDLGEVKGYRNPPHFSKFNILVRKHNVVLTGVPDAILVRADGSLLICDYKTARFTPAQDELLPMYIAQLNAYAVIGEQVGFSPVTGLALLYMEPMTDDGTGYVERCQQYGFDMGFSAHVLKVELNPKLIDPLLSRARQIFDSPSPPAGRPGCKDCQQLDKMAHLLLEN